MITNNQFLPKELIKNKKEENRKNKNVNQHDKKQTMTKLCSLNVKSCETGHNIARHNNFRFSLFLKKN